LASQLRRSTYDAWLEREGVPVVRGHGVPDIGQVELGLWPRLGGRAAYVELEGMEGLTGMYVGEIPPGGALEPEKHLYDKLVYVHAGRGITEVWNRESQQTKQFFEWQAGSLFAPPMNTWHRLINTSGSEPARFLAVTTAPVIMDLFHNIDLIFNCDYVLDDRYDGRADYFEKDERHYDAEWMGYGSWVWETNFIPDVRTSTLDPNDSMTPGLEATCYEMAENVLVGHLAEWPVGRYRKAHHHAGGAILLIVRGQGYTIMWPKGLGMHPYASGHGDQVVRLDWQEGSVFSPPTGWYHQHLNTGPEPVRQLALRYGSTKYGVRFNDLQAGEGVLRTVAEGGTMIEFEDEDPAIRRHYQEALAKSGVPYQMPQDLSAPRRS
jgi:quercetin dioxygenase-like cupin family protein